MSTGIGVAIAADGTQGTCCRVSVRWSPCRIQVIRIRAVGVEVGILRRLRCADRSTCAGWRCGHLGAGVARPLPLGDRRRLPQVTSRPAWKAMSTACSSLAASSLGRQRRGRQPIAHGPVLCRRIGSLLFTATGVKLTSVLPIGSATHPWLPKYFAVRVTPFGIVMWTALLTRSMTGLLTLARPWTAGEVTDVLLREVGVEPGDEHGRAHHFRRIPACSDRADRREAARRACSVRAPWRDQSRTDAPHPASGTPPAPG